MMEEHLTIQIVSDTPLYIDMTDEEFIKVANGKGQELQLDTRLHDMYVNSEGLYIHVDTKL